MSTIPTQPHTRFGGGAADRDQPARSERDGLSDEDLAARAQTESRPEAAACFGVLVRRHQDRLYNFLLRRTGNATLAEEGTQDGFVRAWERLETYRPGMRFSTWLYTVAIRATASRARRRKDATLASLPDAPSRSPGPMHTVADIEARERALGPRQGVWSLVETVLTPVQRDAVWLRYVEDLEVNEIARVLGKSGVGVRVMLFRARAVLARHLESAESPEGTRP